MESCGKNNMAKSVQLAREKNTPASFWVINNGNGVVPFKYQVECFK